MYNIRFFSKIFSFWRLKLYIYISELVCFRNELHYDKVKEHFLRHLIPAAVKSNQISKKCP